MVFKNVTDLMKRHTALFVILLISQILRCLASFLFLEFFKIICMSYVITMTRSL